MMLPGSPARRSIQSPKRNFALHATTFGSAWLLLGSLLSAFHSTSPTGNSELSSAVRSNEIQYGRDIRPILSDRCFLCHGTDDNTREANLRLDRREDAIRDNDGTIAIVPGDVEASELWYRITTDDPSEVMPPPETHRALLDEGERDLVRRWIEQGAPYQEHWAFQIPQRPESIVGGRNQGAHPIDLFWLRELAANEFQASEPVAPELALRRLFLDLTGLPPSPEEIGAFLIAVQNGSFSTAWNLQIDQIFQTEPYRSRYAERMTSPWLDQARYADTIGIHTDNGRQIWPWRDWVLRAYRDNMPFDQFLTEQIAGDLLPNATQDQKVASGFLRNHVVTDEGGAIDEEYLVEYAVDRVDTTSRVFLGLTVSCARCHDHKFDPIRQQDYYQLLSFFASNAEPGLYTQDATDPNRAFEPFIEVPTEEQVEQRDALTAAIQTKQSQLDTPSEADRAAQKSFLESLPASLGLQWSEATVLAAESSGGSTLTIEEDGVVLASGTNPDTDTHRIRLRTDQINLRLLQLDALGHESFANGAPGRAGNGNAVLSHLKATAISVANPNERQELTWAWAWADFEQSNEDFSLLRALGHGPNNGWALGTHIDPSERVALFITDQPFGYEGGTEIVVELKYAYSYANHSFGRIRLDVASVSDSGLARLPVNESRWYHAGPFPVEGAEQAYEASFGPQEAQSLDFEATFEGNGPIAWNYQADFTDGQVHNLPAGVNVHYVAREIYSPTVRELEISIGSDDGFAIYLNGTSVASKMAPRGCAPDQDKVTLPLLQGRNSLVFKIVNTGGPAGYYYKSLPKEDGLPPDLLLAVAEAKAFHNQGAVFEKRISHAWRLSDSEEYRTGMHELDSLVQTKAELENSIPRTMVMRDREMPRPVYLLERGQYDKPNLERPMRPDIPAVFGSLLKPGMLDPRSQVKPIQLASRDSQLEGSQTPSPSPDSVGGSNADIDLAQFAGASRVDLAKWMVSHENPLVARVAVNRLWQLVFGTGLVSTSGDFGYQGAWPSHPELLDWLAVEFVESGWDVQHMLRWMMTSGVYLQGSEPTEDALKRDPDNHLLSHFPRRRMDGERIRDLALFVSGLMSEEFGGRPVKPYQPNGLWTEVAMLASNTRNFEPGMGSDNWRRSVYTYWKRACPPPTLMTFDAPTREACIVQRGTTNTPLQALALWNDEQFREAARVLAQRTLEQILEEELEESAGLQLMFQRCTGRLPSQSELEALQSALQTAEARYGSDYEAAQAWIQVGGAPIPMDVDPGQLAAWSMIASAMLNLHATLTNG